MPTSTPHRAVVACGLALTSAGFVLAGVRTGSGPRLVPGAAEVAGLYLPPVVAGVVVLVVAAVVVAVRRRWTVLGGGVVAIVLLLGSATFGLAGIVFRLGHPADVLPFVADAAQLLGELGAVGGGVLARTKTEL